MVCNIIKISAETSHRAANPVRKEGTKWIQLSSSNRWGSFGPNTTAQERRGGQEPSPVENCVFWVLSKIQKCIVPKKTFVSLSYYISFPIKNPNYFFFQYGTSNYNRMCDSSALDKLHLDVLDPIFHSFDF